MGDGIVKKYAIMINTSSGRKNMDDVSLVHKALRSDGYRTLVASPKKPSSSSPTFFMKPDLSKIGIAVKKFARAIDDDDKLVIYVGGKSVSNICSQKRTKTRNELVRQLLSLTHGTLVTLTGPDVNARSGIKESLALAFGLRPTAPMCTTSDPQADIFANSCIAAGERSYSYDKQGLAISQIARAFRGILNRRGCDAALKVLKSAGSWHEEMNRIGLLIAINSYKGCTPIKPDVIAKAIMVVGSIFDEGHIDMDCSGNAWRPFKRRVLREISSAFKKLLEQKAWDKALEVLNAGSSWDVDDYKVGLIEGINLYSGNAAIRPDVIAKAIMLVGQKFTWHDHYDRRAMHGISRAVTILYKQKALTALKRVTKDATSWTSKRMVLALTRAVSDR